MSHRIVLTRLQEIPFHAQTFTGGASTLHRSCCGWHLLGHLLGVLWFLAISVKCLLYLGVVLSLIPYPLSCLAWWHLPGASLSGSLGYTSPSTTSRWQPIRGDPNLIIFNSQLSPSVLKSLLLAPPPPQLGRYKLYCVHPPIHTCQ